MVAVVMTVALVGVATLVYSKASTANASCTSGCWSIAGKGTNGYWVLGGDGGIFSYGTTYHGGGNQHGIAHQGGPAGVAARPQGDG